MKYSTNITINKPIEEVLQAFEDTSKMKEWMKGLESFEIISGNPGQVGSKSKLIFNMNGRKMEMIETITERNLPSMFAGTYEAKGVWNKVENSFKEINATQTYWETTNEFVMSSLLMKIIGFLMPGSFKKTSLQYQINFKQMIEK